MEEFLVSLVVGRRDIPKKFASVYEQLRSCGAIAKDSRLYRLAPVFMLARVYKNSGGLFAHNIASPKDRGLRLRSGRDRRANALADGDLVLLLIKSKEPRIIKVLNRHSAPASRLLCLVQKRGKIIALDCKSLEPISLPFSQKSLCALPKYCVLEYSAGQITKVLGSLLDPSVDEKLILAKYNFAGQALAKLRKLSPIALAMSMWAATHREPISVISPLSPLIQVMPKTTMMRCFGSKIPTRCISLSLM